MLFAGQVRSRAWAWPSLQTDRLGSVEIEGMWVIIRFPSETKMVFVPPLKGRDEEESGNPIVCEIHEYGIVLDAGSSRTTVYVYQWPAEKENNTGVVSQTFKCSVKGKD
ncbi:hypothetical protein P7K49_031350 [Saguinus oedipus]|uniref:Uncharacterized protein n=1 Tax=Saguinus oedipus TaxID=9490 RepID=A0ABQ9TZ65_SAGOE|nr:hypothetical protein P7K49_031350 [Saguinus oedipus]